MPEEVTIFTPSYEGMTDIQNGPHAYRGRLSPEQMIEIGKRLGEGYARTALIALEPNEWYLSYNRLDIEPERDENGEQYEDGQEGTGKLAYCISVVKLN